MRHNQLIYTLDFAEIGLKDIGRVGGKNASLGELFNSLKPQGVGVIDGFATTADAYRALLAEGELEYELRSLVSDFDHEDVEELRRRGQAARAIAHAYSVFATGGRELGLRRETLQELTAPAVPAKEGFYDDCIKVEVAFSLGFMKPNSGFPFLSDSSFGHPGAGGSLGFADPEAQIGYAYVPNRKGTTMGGDPRDVALRSALFSATPAARN